MSPRIGLDLQTILQAAAGLADTHGFEQVTLASLAQKLDIRSPSLYNHVHGLNCLRKKMAIYGLELLYGALTKAAVGKAGDEAVHGLGQAYLAFARAHPGLYEATILTPDPRDPEIQQVGNQIVELIVQVLRYYGLKDDDALHVVRGLRSILHGFASLEQRGGFGLPLDLDTSFRMLVDTYLAGIRSLQREKHT